MHIVIANGPIKFKSWLINTTNDAIIVTTNEIWLRRSPIKLLDPRPNNKHKSLNHRVNLNNSSPCILSSLMAQLNYDYEINYQSSKANVVADALSRKSSIELATASISQPQLIMELKRWKLEVMTGGSLVLLSSMVVQLELLERIENAQENDPKCQRIRK
jgi:hypothetical protein